MDGEKEPNATDLKKALQSTKVVIKCMLKILLPAVDATP